MYISFVHTYMCVYPFARGARVSPINARQRDDIRPGWALTTFWKREPEVGVVQYTYTRAHRLGEPPEEGHKQWDGAGSLKGPSPPPQPSPLWKTAAVVCVCSESLLSDGVTTIIIDDDEEPIYKRHTNLASFIVIYATRTSWTLPNRMRSRAYYTYTRYNMRSSGRSIHYYHNGITLRAALGRIK